ncbi:hypothetical protein QYF36_017275 [Acer negundo]|nr:hypothetical protein QYF36_017275 [Acer negundo]
MADSQTDSKLFSVRIVSIDHYMVLPIPGFDFCYSNFQDDAYTHAVSVALGKALKALGKALKLKGKTGSYAIEHLDKSQAIILMMLLVLLVFSWEVLFLIRVCSPMNHISPLFSSLCCFTKSRQGRIISNCVLVKFAAVTTYKIDYNLYGMGHLHLLKVKFRHPVPDVCTTR